MSGMMMRRAMAQKLMVNRCQAAHLTRLHSGSGLLTTLPSHRWDLQCTDDEQTLANPSRERSHPKFSHVTCGRDCECSGKRGCSRSATNTGLVLTRDTTAFAGCSSPLQLMLSKTRMWITTNWCPSASCQHCFCITVQNTKAIWYYSTQFLSTKFLSKFTRSHLTPLLKESNV